MSRMPSRMLLAVALAFSLPAALAGCRSAPEGGNTPLSMPERPIEQVLAERSPEWMSWEGVVATAIGQLDDGRPCLLVYLAYEDQDLRARFPESVEGHPVVVEVSGEIRAMPDTGSGGVGP